MVLPVRAMESSFLQRACSLAQMLARASWRRASSPLAPCPSVQVSRVCVSQWPNMQRRMRRCLRRCGRHGVFFYFCITITTQSSASHLAGWTCCSPWCPGVLLLGRPHDGAMGGSGERGRESSVPWCIHAYHVTCVENWRVAPPVRSVDTSCHTYILFFCPS